MKSTIFEIDVDCLSDDKEAEVALITVQLQQVPGVVSVRNVPAATSDKLLVSVSFRGADQAKTIHGKIMRQILATKKFRVRGITTNLSDVFS